MQRDDSGELTLSGAQRAVDAWIGQFREGYWSPLANLARLIEEVGELARELNHRHGPKRKRADEPEADLGLELGDVLFVLVAIANEQGIDLEEAFRSVLAKYERRDADRWERGPGPAASSPPGPGGPSDAGRGEPSDAGRGEPSDAGRGGQSSAQPPGPGDRA